MNNTQSFYRCKNCNQEIVINTNSNLVYCQCGKLGVDGDGDYVRVVCDESDFELIEKYVF